MLTYYLMNWPIFVADYIPMQTLLIANISFNLLYTGNLLKNSEESDEMQHIFIVEQILRFYSTCIALTAQNDN